MRVMKFLSLAVIRVVISTFAVSATGPGSGSHHQTRSNHQHPIELGAGYVQRLLCRLP